MRVRKGDIVLSKKGKKSKVQSNYNSLAFRAGMSPMARIMERVSSDDGGDDDADSIILDAEEGMEDSVLIESIEASTRELVSLGCLNAEEIDFIYTEEKVCDAETETPPAHGVEGVPVPVEPGETLHLEVMTRTEEGLVAATETHQIDIMKEKLVEPGETPSMSRTKKPLIPKETPPPPMELMSRMEELVSPEPQIEVVNGVEECEVVQVTSSEYYHIETQNEKDNSTRSLLMILMDNDDDASDNESDHGKYEQGRCNDQLMQNCVTVEGQLDENSNDSNQLVIDEDIILKKESISRSNQLVTEEVSMEEQQVHRVVNAADSSRTVREPNQCQEIVHTKYPVPSGNLYAFGTRKIEPSQTQENQVRPKSQDLFTIDAQQLYEPKPRESTSEASSKKPKKEKSNALAVSSPSPSAKSKKQKPVKKNGAVIMSYSENYEGLDQELPNIIQTASMTTDLVAEVLKQQPQPPPPPHSINISSTTATQHPAIASTTIFTLPPPPPPKIKSVKTVVDVEVTGSSESVEVYKYILQPGLCRVCLLTKEKLTPIFEDYKIDLSNGVAEIASGHHAAHKFSLIAALKLLLDIEVKHNDGLPDMICSECYDKVHDFSVYRKKIALGQFKLNEIIEKVKTSSLPTLIPAMGEENMLKTEVFKHPNSIMTANEILKKSPNAHLVKRHISDRVWDKIMISLNTSIGRRSEQIRELEEYTWEGPYTKAFFCKLCNSTIPGSREHFIKHSEKVHEMFADSILFPCDICGESLPMMETVNSLGYPEHWLTHFYEHECKFCQKKLPSVRSLWSHKTYSHEKERLYDCTVPNCGKSFYQKPHLETHLRTHLDEATRKSHLVPCEICEKLLSRNSLEFHMKVVHANGGRTWKCDVCSKIFKRKDLVISHKETVHLGLKKYSCDICGASFKSSSSKSGHMARHRGEKQHKCEICSQTFFTKNNLNAHMVKHKDNSEGFPCTECGKSFKRASYLTEHKKSHTGETPYKCNICGSEIRHKSNFFKHMSKHKKKNEVDHDMIEEYAMRNSDSD